MHRSGIARRSLLKDKGNLLTTCYRICFILIISTQSVVSTFTCTLCTKDSPQAPCLPNDVMSTTIQCDDRDSFCLTIQSVDMETALYKGCNKLHACFREGVTWYNQTIRQLCCANSSPLTPCNLTTSPSAPFVALNTVILSFLSTFLFKWALLD